MTSKATRRARKRNRISLPGGGESIAPRTQGQRAPAENPRATVIAARLRLADISEDDALLPLSGDDMGRCIMHAERGHDTRLRLWGVWQAMCAAQANYRTRILGQSGNPQGSAITMTPDPMQTDTSLVVDIRTADERDRAAKVAHTNWTRRINALPINKRWCIREALIGFSRASLWRDKAPTSTGLVAVDALRDLNEAG